MKIKLICTVSLLISLAMTYVCYDLDKHNNKSKEESLKIDEELFLKSVEAINGQKELTK